MCECVLYECWQKGIENEREREGGTRREEEVLERMSDKEEIKMCVKEQTREIRRVKRKRGRGISGLELSTYTYRY